MQRVFRSRGIRLIKSNGDISYKEKVYYEPDDSYEIKNLQVNDLQANGIISLFEYSVVDKEIDAFNFHVNLNCDYQDIYDGIPKCICNEIKEMHSVLGDPFKNYTIGYKFKDTVITGRSYYYYPTVWKKTRYGIEGITDASVIKEKLNKFYGHIDLNEKLCSDEKETFISYMYKLKGISISYEQDGMNYKVYGRIEMRQLKSLLKNYMGYDLKDNGSYGPVVLVAQRICNSVIVGYNIYYLV
ncbi:hypothetical protein [Roseburia sp. 831b]|uniref:hypothetical protein n=1 Tax=Roseburia sp. 831b TaxID=1261635 RepID=UPI000950B981|nr:hypothetical protein [Roseburia sp. 831b]WVK74179.1 hypothetical protein BIV16_06570 [Roseburia sp. 831b]